MSETSATIQERPADTQPQAASVIADDAQAIAAAHALAQRLAQGAAERDRERRLPRDEIEWFSQSGLWAITVPKAYGGAGVSHVTLTEVVKIVAAADPSLGQLPQNHFGLVDVIALTGTDAQKRLFFSEVLSGKRFGNGFSEKGHETRARPEDARAPGRRRLRRRRHQVLFDRGAVRALRARARPRRRAPRVARLHPPAGAGADRDRRLVGIRAADHRERHGRARQRARACVARAAGAARVGPADAERPAVADHPGRDRRGHRQGRARRYAGVRAHTHAAVGRQRRRARGGRSVDDPRDRPSAHSAACGGGVARARGAHARRDRGARRRDRGRRRARRWRWARRRC